MIEYTRELINSNCDLNSLNVIVERNYKKIISKVFNKINENKQLCNEVTSYNDNILKNPRLSRLIGNPNTSFPVNLKEEPEVTKKIVYDLTSEKDFRSLIQTNFYHNQNELPWKFILEMIIKNLKKLFTDSNIYYQNKEVFDVHDNVTIHRLIIVDWS